MPESCPPCRCFGVLLVDWEDWVLPADTSENLDAILGPVLQIRMGTCFRTDAHAQNEQNHGMFLFTWKALIGWCAIKLYRTKRGQTPALDLDEFMLCWYYLPGFAETGLDPTLA